MRYSIFSKNSCPLLNIGCIGYANDPQVTRFGPGRRDVYIIHYVLSGKGYFNGSTVSAGQGFLITPGMPQEYYPDKTDPWEFVWIISDDPKMCDLFHLYKADQKNIFRYDFVYTIKSLSEQLIMNQNAILDSYELLEMFLRIFKHHRKDDAPLGSRASADLYVEAAANYIHANIFRPITVTELTAFLGISQPYLYKLFKENFSKSPKQYILDQKLILAQKLLKETDMTVTQVATSVGFADVLSFSKLFSSKIGTSPKNYRCTYHSTHHTV